MDVKMSGGKIIRTLPNGDTLEKVPGLGWVMLDYGDEDEQEKICVGWNVALHSHSGDTMATRRAA